MGGVFVLVRIKEVRADHSWESALGRFLEYKRAESLAEQTQNDYTQHVTRFMRRYPTAWSTSDRLAEAAFDYLAEDITPSTYNNRLVYLRTFFNWCVERGIIGSNPIANIKKRKAEPRVVSIDEKILRELLKLPDQDKYTGLRDYCIILITLDCGIRPSEAFRLLPVDFREKAAEIHIPAKIAKARKSRTLPLSDMTVRALRKLLLARPDEWGPDVPIFCTYEGRQLNRHTWGDWLELYSEQLGVHIRPYDLRHAFSLEYIRSGAGAFGLQKMLGHGGMEMTRRYVALANEDLKVEHAKASPLMKLTATTKRNTNIKK
jgi:integrase